MTEPSSAPRSFFSAIVGTIPTLLVLGLIGAVGYWGHTNGWKMPKFSALKGEVKEPDDWCAEHGVPDSICVECKPELMPKPKEKGWCDLHRLPECNLCNPNLAQLSRQATVSEADLEKAAQALAFTPRTELNPICKTHQRRIQFADESAVKKAGIEIHVVGKAPALEFVSAPGEIGYDPSRVAHLSSRSVGTVLKVFKQQGDKVEANELLALVDAAEVGKAKTELLQAHVTLQLRKQSAEALRKSAGSIPESRVLEAEAAERETAIRLHAARQMLVNLGLPLDESELAKTTEQLQSKLHFLGIPEKDTRAFDAKTTTSNLIPLVAPMAGTIVSREVVAGEVVDNARILFAVVDTSALWLTLDLKAEDAQRVSPKQAIRFRVDGEKGDLPGEPPTVVWISPQVDPKTRTVKARANLPNTDGKLRANSYGSGRVILREESAVVSVPNDAVQSEGCCTIVFVRDKDFLKPESPKVFHVRKVRTGAKDDANTEIIAGLLPGEIVVTKGSGLLLTELLRGNLGDGCCGHNHAKD